MGEGERVGDEGEEMGVKGKKTEKEGGEGLRIECWSPDWSESGECKTAIEASHGTSP